MQPGSVWARVGTSGDSVGVALELGVLRSRIRWDRRGSPLGHLRLSGYRACVLDRSRPFASLASFTLLALTSWAGLATAFPSAVALWQRVDSPLGLVSAWAALGTGSVILHELGHVLAMLAVGPQKARFVVRRLRLYQVREPRSPVRDAAIVLSGPATPAVGFLSWHLINECGPVWSIPMAVIATAHLAVLVAPTGDGANLRELLPRTSRRSAG